MNTTLAFERYAFKKLMFQFVIAGNPKPKWAWATQISYDSGKSQNFNKGESVHIEYTVNEKGGWLVSSICRTGQTLPPVVNQNLPQAVAQPAPAVPPVPQVQETSALVNTGVTLNLDKPDIVVENINNATAKALESLQGRISPESIVGEINKIHAKFVDLTIAAIKKLKSA